MLVNYSELIAAVYPNVGWRLYRLKQSGAIRYRIIIGNETVATGNNLSLAWRNAYNNLKKQGKI